MYLVCLKCGETELFVDIFRLRVTQTGGAQREVNGQACQRCLTKVDTGKMAAKLDKIRKLAEYERLKMETEMEGTCPAADQKAPAKSST